MDTENDLMPCRQITTPYTYGDGGDIIMSDTATPDAEDAANFKFTIPPHQTNSTAHVELDTQPLLLPSTPDLTGTLVLPPDLAAPYILFLRTYFTPGPHGS